MIDLRPDLWEGSQLTDLNPLSPYADLEEGPARPVSDKLTATILVGSLTTKDTCSESPC